MKKFIHILTISFILIIFSNKTYAQNSIVEVNINGDIKKNNNIEISINFNDIRNLYAASIDYEYDNKSVEILDIEPSSFIKNDKVKIMEFGENTNKYGNKASYYFTCLGSEKGISGSGNFVKIKAKILKDEGLSINSDNMILKLATKNNDNTIEALNYTLNINKNQIIVKPNHQSNDSDLNVEIENNDKNEIKIESNKIESNVLSQQDSDILVEHSSDDIEELDKEQDKEVKKDSYIKDKINITNDNKYIYLIIGLSILVLVYFILKKWKSNN